MSPELSQQEIAQVMALIEPLTSSKTDEQTRAAMRLLDEQSPGFCKLIIRFTPFDHEVMKKFASTGSTGIADFDAMLNANPDIAAMVLAAGKILRVS